MIPCTGPGRVGGGGEEGKRQGVPCIAPSWSVVAEGTLALVLARVPLPPSPLRPPPPPMNKQTENKLCTRAVTMYLAECN